MELKNIIKAVKSIKNPLEFRKFVFYKLISLLYKKNKGDYILDEKWDNLIILDACRYDFFEKFLQRWKLPGVLEQRNSRGSHTKSFLTENFKNQSYNDIIYITANPYVDIMVREKFCKVISVWIDGWSKKYHTVLPETTYQYTLKTIKEQTGKKLIIHFMQPHYPYIDLNVEIKTLETLRESAQNKKLTLDEDFNKKQRKEKFCSLYSYYVYKMFDIDTHIRGYWRNLEVSFPYIKKLLKKLPGKTIITADHGEAFGEFIHPFIPIKYYGHRESVRIPILTKVPWFISKNREENLQNKKLLTEKDLIAQKVKGLRDRNDLIGLN